MKWKKMDRNLKEDEIIRTLIKPGEKIYGYSKPGILVPDCSYEISKEKEKGEYLYGRNTGGFGSKMNTIGNAIFVKNVSSEFELTKKRDVEVESRWERYWGIEITEEV